MHEGIVAEQLPAVPAAIERMRCVVPGKLADGAERRAPASTDRSLAAIALSGVTGNSAGARREAISARGPPAATTSVGPAHF
jgi:hypothetical protein